MTLVLANANVIDGVRPGVTAGVSVTIEEGRIVEAGAYDALVQQGGIFAQLVMSAQNGIGGGGPWRR